MTEKHQSCHVEADVARAAQAVMSVVASMAVPSSGDKDLDLLVEDSDPFTCTESVMRELQDAALEAYIRLLRAGKPRLSSKARLLGDWLAGVADTRRRWHLAIDCEMGAAEALATIEKRVALLGGDQAYARRRLLQQDIPREHVAHVLATRAAGDAGERAMVLHLRLGLESAQLVRATAKHQ